MSRERFKLPWSLWGFVETAPKSYSRRYYRPNIFSYLVLHVTRNKCPFCCPRPFSCLDLDISKDIFGKLAAFQWSPFPSYCRHYFNSTLGPPLHGPIDLFLGRKESPLSFALPSFFGNSNSLPLALPFHFCTNFLPGRMFLFVPDGINSYSSRWVGVVCVSCVPTLKFLYTNVPHTIPHI